MAYDDTPPYQNATASGTARGRQEYNPAEGFIPAPYTREPIAPAGYEGAFAVENFLTQYNGRDNEMDAQDQAENARGYDYSDCYIVLDSLMDTEDGRQTPNAKDCM